MGIENSVDIPSSSHSGCRNEKNEINSFEHGIIDADIPPPNDANKSEGILNIENLQESVSNAVTGNSVDAPSSHKCRNENNESPSYEHGLNEADVSPFDDKENILNRENLQENVTDAGKEGNCCMLDMDIYDDVVENPSIVQVSVEFTETATLAGNLNSFSSRAGTVISSVAVHEESFISDEKTGRVKRAGVAFDELQPPVHVDEPQSSIHVVYNSLTRASKRKLQEMLQQWSEWHAKNLSTSQEPSEVLESGEETYFPALRVGTAESSAVSFWIDNQSSKHHAKEFVPLDSNSVPLYDRGYALGLTSADSLGNIEGGLEIVDDASRCFNCGSYNHPMKECPRPRDNVSVNKARKHFKSKRNQNSGSRTPTRYYQKTPGGKYDGLRPGVLDAETRKLLGIGELDPPPWFNRMQEIGYPRGYLDDDEDQPSGIIIFADEEAKQEEGENFEKGNHEPPKKMPVETDHHKRRRKMMVEFPGINVPIPQNADARRWEARPSGSDFSGNQPYDRSKHYSETTSRGQHHERRWSRDFRDDGPPGIDPGVGAYLSCYSPKYNTYPSARYNSCESPRYGGLYSSHLPYSSDWGRWSHLVREESRFHDSYCSSEESSCYFFRDRSPLINGTQADHHRLSWW